MAQKIEQDLKRFKEIIRGRVKKELRKYISNGELVGRQGKDIVSIPIPRINIPHFIYGDKQKGGLGSGDGDGDGQVQPGEGDSGKAGNSSGEHMVEVDVSFEELAKLLGDELELPRIEPKGINNIDSNATRYTGMATSGPESLRHFKRTFKRALKRQLISGLYQPDKPLIVPIREDRVYRTWKQVNDPQSRALIVYMMDVSGSMGNEQKNIVRQECFWIDTWIRSQYKNVDIRFIIHDAVAKEVDRDTFFTTRESGGTIISSAYKLFLQILYDNYDPNEWNIYPFHFSDGDNWSGNDTDECLRLMDEHIFSISNMFGYGQVVSDYGSGQFLKDLNERFKDHDVLITSEILNRDGIVDSIKTFLGKGK